MELRDSSAGSHDRTINCTGELVESWEGGSHIDIPNGSINLCTSVARINTNSMYWEATKEGFHQNWWEMQGRSPSAFSLAMPSDPELHQPPRRLALPPHHYIVLAMDQSIFFGDVSNHSAYASSRCCQSVRPVDAGRVRLSIAEPFIRLQGSAADRTPTEPCELYEQTARSRPIFSSP
jgi:hypothetical protein